MRGLLPSMRAAAAAVTAMRWAVQPVGQGFMSSSARCSTCLCAAGASRTSGLGRDELAAV